MELNIDLVNNAPEYGMYTNLGNAAVHAIVTRARAERMTWAQTLIALRALAEQDEFGEAMDTAVREYVYHALGIKDENFYI